MAGQISRRSVLRGAVALGGAFAAGPVLWQRPGYAATPPSGVHLTYGADPTAEMTASWSTEASVRNARLLLADATGQVSQVFAADSVASPGLQAVQHHVQLTGLDPATRYRYQVVHDGSQSAQFDFTTAVPLGSGEPRTVKFTAFGDQGTSEGKIAPVLKAIEDFGPDLHLHVGDLSYASGSGGLRVSEQVESLYKPAVWDTWLADIERVAAKVPWMPVLGNHEMEPTGDESLGYESYFARFRPPATGVPHEAGVTTWSLRIGNVGFVALDGNDVSAEIPRNHGYLNGAQETWLADTLRDLRASADVDWIVVGFHHCAYCSSVRHGSDSGVRAWADLFDQYRVDVVVNGHNHMYERTYPVRRGQATVLGSGETVYPELHGTTYLVSGLAEEDEPLPDTSTEPVAGLTYYTGVDFGIRVPEATPWSAFVDELSPVVIRAEVTPPDARGVTTMAITSVDAATGVVVDRVALERVRSFGG